MQNGACSCGGYTTQQAALHSRDCSQLASQCDVSMMAAFDLQELAEQGVSIRAVIVLDSPLRGAHYVAPPAMDVLLRAIGRRWYSLRDGLPPVEVNLLAQALSERRQDDLASALSFLTFTRADSAPLTKGGTIVQEVAYWQNECVGVLEAFGETALASTLRTLGQQPGTWSKSASLRKGR